jgi:hypothetical protein
MFNKLEIDGWSGKDGLEDGDGWGFGTDHHGEFEGDGYGNGLGIRVETVDEASDGFGYSAHHVFIDRLTNQIVDGDGDGEGVFTWRSDW